MTRRFRSPLRAASCLAALGLAGGVAHAQPDTFWCANQLVREGMAATEIARRCGEPDAVEQIEEPIFARNVNGGTYQIGVTIIEIWTYDRGTQRFPARIKIDNGIATEVALIRQ
jgi:hypothetical protein